MSCLTCQGAGSPAGGLLDSHVSHLHDDHDDDVIDDGLDEGDDDSDK